MQSLVLLALMRRRGLGGLLRIGVKRVDEQLIAHAWVELEQEPVNDNAAYCDQFIVLLPNQSKQPELGLVRYAL
jgi:hypothetical protein